LKTDPDYSGPNSKKNGSIFVAKPISYHTDRKKKAAIDRNLSSHFIKYQALQTGDAPLGAWSWSLICLAFSYPPYEALMGLDLTKN